MSTESCSTSPMTMSSPPVIDSAATTRFYLRVRHKRARDEGVDVRVACAVTSQPTRHVRVRWEDGLGPMPASLQCVSGGGGALLFRRLSPLAAACETGSSTESAVAVRAGETCAPLPPSATAAREQPLLLLQGMRKAGNCLVLECCDAVAAAGVGEGQEEWFVLDRMEDDTADEAACFANAEDEFDFTHLTLSDTSVPAVMATTTKAKRLREAAGGLGEVLPSYRLRRVECGTCDDDHRGLPAVSAPSSSSTTRGAAEMAAKEAGMYEEETDQALLRLLRQYDPDYDACCVNEDDKAAHEAQAELYLYPDHRKDDEYDSNAEDCSNNEYPDEDDESHRAGSHYGSRDADDEADADSAWQRSAGRRGRHDALEGCYYEDSYRERALSSGWSSDEG